MYRGFSDAKAFMGNAYNIGSKIASTVDRHAGTIRRIIGTVAPMAGALTGPVGSAVGTGLGMGFLDVGPGRNVALVQDHAKVE